jgi:hypothetical protein
MVIIVPRIWLHNCVYASKIHVVADALSRLQDFIEPTCVPNQTIDANLFYT